jgi:hypothetical protein
MPGVQKNTSFPLWSKIGKRSGFCGIFKVSKRDLALTFALPRSDVMCVTRSSMACRVGVCGKRKKFRKPLGANSGRAARGL